MRTVVYTISTRDLALYDTFDYNIAKDAKEKGFHISTRLVTRRKPLSEIEKQWRNKRFAILSPLSYSA